MRRSDVYVQPGAEDPVLSEATVLRIARAHTGRAQALLEVDESGGEARAYLLDGEVVVKVQRPHRLRARTSLEKEARILGELAGPLAGRVPRLYGHGRLAAAEGEVEYLVMSRLAGDALVRRSVTGAARSALVREVGALLARLHGVATDRLLTDPAIVPRDRDGADLVRRLEAGFADVVDLIAREPARWRLSTSPQEVVSLALSRVPPAFAPVLLHSNPGPTHTFCSASGSLTGLIDFGDSYLSHPAMDLRTWPDPADRQSLREGYLADATPADGFDAAWTAAMIYTDMAVLATRPELAPAAEAALRARLDTH